MSRSDAPPLAAGPAPEALRNRLTIKMSHGCLLASAMLHARQLISCCAVTHHSAPPLVICSAIEAIPDLEYTKKQVWFQALSTVLSS